MEITCDNYKSVYRNLENVVKNASFAALDFEFAGLVPEDQNQKCSLFDTPEERYRKHRQTVQNFPPLQMGIAFFTPLENDTKYQVEVYNIYLFKSPIFRQEYRFSAGSFTFLDSHGMDFNKLIYEGLSFMNLEEQEKAIQALISKEPVVDSEIFSDDFKSLYMRVEYEIQKELARRRRKKAGSEGAKQSIFDAIIVLLGGQISSLQEIFFLYKLYSTIHGVHLEITSGMLICTPSNQKKSELQNIKANLLQRARRELAGASDIVMSLIEKKMPIVTHNGFFDLLHLYHYFVSDLPEDYDEFKKRITTVFPHLIDTKHVADENAALLSMHGIQSFRIEPLSQLFEGEHPGRSGLPLYEFPIGFNVSGRESAKNRSRQTANFHNAAYDALVTGQVFVKLAHLISRDDVLDGAIPAPIPIRRIIYTLRPYSGKIPVIQHCLPFVNLYGADPLPRYPDEVVLEVLQEKDLLLIQKDVRCVFGRWRTEMKVDGTTVRIATTTDNTYRWMTGHYLRNDSVRVLSVSDSASTTSLADSTYSSVFSASSAGSTPNRLRLRSLSVSSNDTQASESSESVVATRKLSKCSVDSGFSSSGGSQLLNWVYRAGAVLLSAGIPTVTAASMAV
ncbi:unnamed protein product, partial [Mesorhabditis spiculigera]